MIDVTISFGRDVKEAVENIEEDLKRADFCVCFACKKDTKKTYRELKRYINCPIIGCSSAGIIMDNSYFDGIGIAAISTDFMRFLTTCKSSKDDFRLGKQIAEELIRIGRADVLAFYVKKLKDKVLRIGLYSFLNFITGISVNGTRFIEGFKEVTGNYPLIFGGAAGDMLEFKETFVFNERKITNKGASCCLLDTKLLVGIGVGHGWKPISDPFVVTKSRGNLLIEINGEPAIKIYEEFFGEERAHELYVHPLGRLALKNPIGIPDITGTYRLRHPIKALKDGSILMSGDVPEGSVIRIMGAEEKDMIEAAKNAAKEAWESCGCPDEDEIGLVIIPDCAARMMIFGRENAYKEIKAVKEVLGNVPIIGYYTYGEIGPLGWNVGFLNETIVIGIITKKSVFTF